MLCFPMVLTGFRMHFAELQPQTNQRKYVPQIWIRALGVKCYCSQWFFPNNRKNFALASRVPLASTVPHQGWALEMQGSPMVFNVVQLIPRRRQGSIHFHPRFQW